MITTQTVNVGLGDRSYPIFIGDDILHSSYLEDYLDPRDPVMIVTNETIAPLYLDKLLKKLDFVERVNASVLSDGEQFKNLNSIEDIVGDLLSQHYDRQTTLIALGGGVIGDMTGFAAACFQRGVRFIQVPTTLLAQVDSSVGGKTGVNHTSGKNMIGAFYQPQCVIIDVNTLSTLNDREFISGLAEVIKYGLIHDYEFFIWLEKNIEKLLQRDKAALIFAIKRSCENKANVVSNDEKEKGIRAILNLGHTFGHAIETFTHYTELLHGEAIAVGMLMAADLSTRHGWLKPEDYTRIHSLITNAKLPVKVPSKMSPVDFMTLMAVDKKNIHGQLRLVLMESIGSAITTTEFNNEHLAATLDDFST